MDSKAGLYCKHCKGGNIRQEPACIVCMICGWVKYCDDGDFGKLWRQSYLNSQYISNTHKIQLNSLYKTADIPLDQNARILSEDEQRILAPSQRIHIDSIIAYDDYPPRSYLEKEGLL